MEDQDQYQDQNQDQYQDQSQDQYQDQSQDPNIEQKLNVFEAIIRQELGSVGGPLGPFFSQQLRDTRTIEISGNNTLKYRFDDEDFEILMGALVRSEINVQCLSFRHHRLTSKAIVALATLWNTFPIYQIDLEGNDIDGAHISTLTSFLESPNCPCQSLNISCNPIGAAGGSLIGDALKINTSLQRLLMNNCEFDLNGIIAIITCIASNKHSALSHLDISRPLLKNYKNEEICDHVTTRLLSSKYNRLHTLEMRYCHIGDAGAILLAQILMFNNNLKCLNLECNDIGVAGAEALASYMIEKPLDSLESLRLSYNNIADAGAKALSQAFVTNKCLTEISLKSNNINEVGLIAIGNSLFKNNTIQLLTLLGNHFDDNSAKLYGELERDRLPYINLWIDISVYVVDGVHLVAENR